MARKLLIIDDEKSLRSSLKAFLNIKGYEVATADNGIDGIEQAQDFKPDLLLLDLHLSEGITGLEVLRRMKLINPGLKVVVLTGFCDEEGVAGECYKLGAEKFLCKPLTAGEIKEALDAVS